MAATTRKLTQEQAIDVRLATEALQASKADPGAEPTIAQVSALEFAVTQLLAIVADLTGGQR